MTVGAWDFLVLYWVLVAIAVAVAVLAPVLLPAPRPRPVRDDDVGPYEVALLAGGPRRLVDTALAAMVEAGAARITAGAVRPGTVAPRDRIQRYVLSRICHNRRLTSGGDDLGVCQRGPGRTLVRRLLSLGYLSRRRAGAGGHRLLAAVMAVGLCRVLAADDLVPLANMVMVAGILLGMLGMVYGLNALEVRMATGLAVQSRRQSRMVAGVILFVCAVNLMSGAPDGTAGLLASVLATGVIWCGLRAVLRRITAPVATPRGREVATAVPRSWSDVG
jgi:uncharacterized protein (TIGR04222 family)